MFFHRFFLMFSFFLGALQLWAQSPLMVREELVVTATRDEAPARDRPRTIDVLTRREIEESGALTAAELLALVPGITVSANGGYGHATAVYLRGAKPGQVKILLDGVDISDAISTDRSVDLSAILAANIARIEVVYGPASSVYGTDAMAGVVHIITRDQNRLQQVTLESGSKSTGSAALNWQEDLDHATIWARGAAFTTDGISAASERDGNVEPDGFRNTSVNAGLSKVWQTAKWVFNAHHIDGTSDVDDAGGPFGDNPNATFNQRRSSASTALERENPWGHAGSMRLKLDWSASDRRFFDPGVLDSQFSGTQVRANWHHRLHVNDSFCLAVGAEYLEERGTYATRGTSEWGPYEDILDTRHTKTGSLYLNQDIQINSLLSATVGVRYDDHQTFGDQTTASLGFLVTPGTSRIWVHWGTSFKAPTLYQLYSPYGSPELDPEQGKSMEIGFEQTFRDGRWNLNLSAFTSRFDDMIDFDPTNWTYLNVSDADLKGGRAGIDFRTGPLTLRCEYARLETQDASTGAPWLRRPEHSVTAAGTGHWGRWTLHLDSRWASSCDDLDYATWPAERVKLDAYWLANANLRAEINARWIAFAKVRNITDEAYEIVRGYGTLGRSFYAGLTFGFLP